MNFEDRLNKIFNEEWTDPDFLPPEEEETTEDREFKKWMQKVDNNLLDMVGILSADLPDYDYRAAFNAGDTPNDVAKQVIEHAKTF